MSIWTAFFLVVSVVILSSPFLSSRGALTSQSGRGNNDDGALYWEDNELELDLATGRLTREDYEEMTAERNNRPAIKPYERGEEDNGNLPQG